ncbi:MAG: DUF4956 domain-containing protein [Gilvibacter sp.]
MDEFIGQLFQDFDESFSIVGYVINILICAILLFVLSMVYTRFGQAISNRAQLGRVLILVGITTFIIISIVKSSLALSLGLVGALSIIRFRTAIKEPEELGFFFMAISIGLGMGANQLLPTVIGFAILVVVIILLNYKRVKSFSQNLLISAKVTQENKAEVNKRLNDLVIKMANQVELKRLNYSADKVHVNYHVNVSDLDTLTAINEAIFAIDQSAEVTFIDSEI